MTNKYSLISGLKKLNSIKPDPFWAEESRSQLMAQFRQIFPAEKKGLDFYYFKLKPVFATLIVLGVILLSSWGTLAAAKNSVPGQLLYPIKRVAEKVRLVVANKANKNVLRAELLNNRLREAKILAKRLQEISDSEAEKNLVSIAKDIKSEVNVLQKEILSQSPEEVVLDVTFDEGSLPIQDGKQVAAIVLSEELEKSLEETKELLAKKDLSNALTKTIEVNKKLTISQVTSTPEQPEQTDSTSTTTTEPIPVEPKVILKKNPGSIGSLPKQIEQIEHSEDFKISPIKQDFQIRFEREK